MVIMVNKINGKSELTIFLDSVHEEVSKMAFKKTLKQDNKFEKLLSKKGKSISFGPKIVNLSDTVFTDRELELLNQGIKYCPPPRNVEDRIINFMIDVNSKIFPIL